MMSEFDRFERVHGGDGEKQARFELLHDFLKAKREDARRRNYIHTDDDEREIEVADRWLRDLFADQEAFEVRLEQETVEKYSQWARKAVR